MGQREEGKREEMTGLMTLWVRIQANIRLNDDEGLGVRAGKADDGGRGSDGTHGQQQHTITRSSKKRRRLS